MHHLICLYHFQQSIFARLGGKSTVKRPATSTVTFDDDEDDDDYNDDNNALEYAGVLKESPTKKAKIKAATKLKKTAHRTLGKNVIIFLAYFVMEFVTSG